MGFGLFSKDYLNAWMIGLNLVASTFVGLGIGYWLDRKFGTRPWLTLIFLFLGIVSGFLEIYKMVRRAERGASDQDK